MKEIALRKKINWPATWAFLLKHEPLRTHYQQALDALEKQVREQVVYPPTDQLFAAFEHCPPSLAKVVILGQDPYHGPGQANGLAFSVNNGQPIPPSLRNIYKELQADIGCRIPDNGNLTSWARQGVLLLNAILSVAARQPGSHKQLGWQAFTDAVLHFLAHENQQRVFLLWGNFARAKADLITNTHNLVLEAPHPSPFSANRGFFGCRHFSKANQYLRKHGHTPIQWQVPNEHKYTIQWGAEPDD